ncbi:MAG: alpha/beta hydrolase, partial [Deltaproteobacteria bacterium]|nr:alpha/beta hydrolase [Deltaproteobacteria bacterium]
MSLYLNYDRAALDAQYFLRGRHKDFQQHLDRYESESARTVAALGCRRNVPYGPSPEETLDVFPARTPGSPVQVFIHGGYWQAQDKRSYSFVAGPLVAAGAAAVVINYALAPTVGLDEIVRQVRAAVAWTVLHAREFNGDPERIHVSGHSAGGHLTAMMLITDWAELGEQ